MECSREDQNLLSFQGPGVVEIHYLGAVTYPIRMTKAAASLEMN